MDRRVWVVVVILLGIAVGVFLWMQGGGDTSPEPSTSSTEAPKERSETKRVLPAPKPLPMPASTPAADADEPVAMDDEEETVEDDDTPETLTPKVRMGAMSRSSIDDGIRDFMPDIRECYKEALKEVPDLAGRLMVKFTIKGQEAVGRVINVSIKDSDVDDVPMEECLMDVVESIDFDPPKGGGLVIVSYPFVFASE